MPARYDPAAGTKAKARVVRSKATKPVGVFAPKPRTGALGALEPATAPITRAQGQARTAVRKATTKAEQNVVTPYVPKLKAPTQAQRNAPAPLVAQSLRAQGVNTRDQANALPKAARTAYERSVGYQKTVRRQQAAQTKAVYAKSGGVPPKPVQLKAAPAHTKALGIDLTAAGTLAAKLGANTPIAAIAQGLKTGYADIHKLKGVPGHALQDFVDLPANTVTATYKIARDALTGHPLKAASDIAGPIVQTIEHPVKSFEQHPLNTLLIARGIKGGIGHGAGKALRTIPSDTTRRIASTERATVPLPGTSKVLRRQYSKDVLTKGAQVAAEKRAARRGKPEPTMTPKQVRKAVDEDVAAAKIVTGENQARVVRQVRKAVGRKPSAAVSLAAQGVTTASKADLAQYLAEVKAVVPKLKNEAARKANARTQAQIADALKGHDPAKVQAAAEAYSKIAAELEPQVIAHGLVTPHTAEATRLAGVKARRVQRSGPTLKVKQEAGRAVKAARIEAGHAESQFAKAEADARAAAYRNKGRVPPPEHDALLRAIDRRDTAQAALEQAQTVSRAAKIAHTRAFQPAGTVEPAYVSHQAIPPRAAALPRQLPRVPTSEQRTGGAVRTGTLDVRGGKLAEQAAGTQRLIDAAKARERFIEDYGYRGHADQPVQPFASARGAKTWAQRNIEDATGHKWRAIQQADGQYALVPKVALSQVKAHEKAVVTHPVMRAASGQWRRNVLAFSPRWLTGNIMEAGLRSAIEHAGPRSYVTARRTLAELERTDPDAAQALRARALGGGNYSAAERVTRDTQLIGDDLGRMARALHAIRQTPGPKQIADLYGAYTSVVFRSLNGRLENQFQTAMLGKALRDHPLMSDYTVKLSQKAVQQAAEGLRNTDVQVELGRQVDRMYGRYGKFSPGLRNAISAYTPFIAWTINATNFLYHTLPQDHPVLTGLLASANTATEAWRKQHGLYLDFLAKTQGQLPPWLQGSIPGTGGSHLRVSRYTPFGLLAQEGSTPISGLQGLLLPQLSEITNNLAGKDWQGKSLSSSGDKPAIDVLAAAASLLEGQVPLASQAAAVSGARLPNMRDTQKVTPGVSGRARATFDPFRFTPASKTVTAKGSGASALRQQLGLPASSASDIRKQLGLPTSSASDIRKQLGLVG